MDEPPLSTFQKAPHPNLDATVHGTFAEIGAGQAAHVLDPGRSSARRLASRR